MEPGPFPLELSDHLSPVGVAVIPDDDNVPRYRAQELPQETGDIVCPDVLPRELEVERQVLAHGANRDGGDSADP